LLIAESVGKVEEIYIDKTMTCPHCGSVESIGYGTSKSGNPRYQCKSCGKTFTGVPSGRPPIGDRAMTRNERGRKTRQAKKRKEAAEKIIDELLDK
jgi:DNA-directed RNA polymerase subunit RPC12/RpoP